MNTPDDLSVDFDAVFQDIELPHAGDRAVALNTCVKAAEVKVALKSCKCDKAAGPDRLSNDWYRDHKSDLLPLTVIFAAWVGAGIQLDSFAGAHVFCLKKTSTSAAPLGFRPLALLNTNYKIYARVWANRLNPWLGSVVSLEQAGFVPRRSIHTVLVRYLRPRASQKMTHDTVKLLHCFWSLQKRIRYRVAYCSGFCAGSGSRQAL